MTDLHLERIAASAFSALSQLRAHETMVAIDVPADYKYVLVVFASTFLMNTFLVVRGLYWRLSLT